MKTMWQTQARRIDALSLRERVIMFASLALALGALVDVLLLSPAIAERRALAEQMRRNGNELGTLRAQLAAVVQTGTDTPLGRRRAAVERARAELQSLDAQVQARLARRDEVTRLPELLERVLRRHERLTLTRLATVEAPRSAGADGAASGLHWQAVELSVAGSYLDLMQYLAALEQELPGLRWGALQIATQTQPPVLTVRLLLAGEQP